MYGFVLLLPFLLIRFGLLSLLNQEAVPRAAYFAPVRGGERVAYWIYQVSNAGIFLTLFFVKIFAAFSWHLVLGLNTNGVYGISRNPMYVSYFICFIGMALLTRSWILFGFVAAFQISAHWIILSEERWCLERFGAAYKQYMKTARRYI